MKVVVAGVVGIVILALGVGVYRWLDRDHERKRAEAAAREMAAFCRRQGSLCEVVRVEPLSEDKRWRLHMRNPQQGLKCWEVDLDDRTTERDSVYVGGTVHGISDMACSADQWTPQQAARRLENSAWGRARKAQFFSCAGTDKARFVPYTRRFGCRYSSPRGEGYVVIRTTGRDTFELEPSR